MIKTIPKHVAIVMDGNGRWAEKRSHPRVFGHVRGCTRVREIVKKANELGIEALTLYAFSTENWNRPESERAVLWKLLKKYLIRDEKDLAKENIRLAVIGNINQLSADVKNVMLPIIHRLSKNTGMRLTFALSYGARAEITKAAQTFAEQCIAGKLQPADLNESLFGKFLSQTEGPQDVDLFIRTSGEKRISNFLLWQSAYAEFVFSNTLWPDFRAQDLIESIKEFNQRDRRFGRIYSQKILALGSI